MAPPRYEALIAGETSGIVASGARAALRGLSAVYGLGVAARNCLFDVGLRTAFKPQVPVLSVGNLTVGGTGKTPMVLWLCEHLIATGRRVAVLARGYGASDGRPNDELALVSRRCPDAVCIANPDRCAGARMAMEEHKPDVILLDDGFQHRRIGRDLDIVLLDATCPFGYGHMLPRGLLREPPRALRRAGLVVLTQTDRVRPDAREALVRRVREMAGDIEVVACRHRADGFVELDGRPADAPPRDGSRVACVSSIARPESFEHTVRGLGHDPIASRSWPDHHAYIRQDIAEIQTWAERLSVDAILTTEKDAVKLAPIAPEVGSWSCPVLTVRVAIDFESHDDTRLIACVERCVEDASARARGVSDDPEGDLRHS